MINIRKGTEDEADFLRKMIDEFNSSKVPFHKEKIFEDASLFVTDDNNKIIGGVLANLIMDSSLSIHVLWIEENFRHQKIGSQLLSKLEQNAILAGAHMAHLDTFDFQALEFYQKNGYEIFGVLEGSPCQGHKRYYMRKDLR